MSGRTFDSLTLREIEMPLAEPFVTRHGAQTVRRVVVVEGKRSGLIGYGEAPVLSSPHYHEETVETVWHVIRDHLAPAVLKGDRLAAEDVAAELAKFAGHPMAKSAVEAAAWDLDAQEKGISIVEALGGRPGRVDSGIVIGFQPDEVALRRAIESALEQGYRRIKLKIAPGRDLDALRSVRRRFGQIPLAVDANGAYSLQDMERLRRFDEFGLLFIEQPFAAGDLVDHARLQEQIETPVALDESVRSPADVRSALALGACRAVVVKAARLGGLAAAKEAHDLCLAEGVPVCCGGLLETGIGRALNLALACLPNFTLAGDLSASSRYWNEDIVEPAAELEADGTLLAPGGPGLGVRVRRSVLESVTVRREELAAR